MTLILASTSTYRKSLLKKLHVDFVCESPQVEESRLAGEKPEDMALRLATEKATAVAKRHTSAIVIGSDQVASLDGKPLGKPGTQEAAIEQLSACSGKTVSFYTGLCVIDAASGKQSTIVEQFDVVFKTLTKSQISRYIEIDNPLDCAGSFKSESFGIALFEQLRGRDPNTLVGLPLIALCDILPEFGVSIL